MGVVNTVLNPVVDLLQRPLAGLPPWLGVLLWSIPVGILALLVFKWTSNQRRIAEVKDRIAAGLFEIRLFNDDLRAILRAQREILGQVLRYQALALKPMLFILPPLLLLMVQLHAFYGFRTPTPNESVLLRARLEGAGPARPEISLQTPSGVEVETPGVWAADLEEMAWRIRVTAAGDHELTVVTPNGEFAKRLRATAKVERLSPTRPGPNFMGQLEWPSEPPLPEDGPVTEITVDYPDARFDALVTTSEWRYAWMVVFFVLTMVVAVAVKKPLRVEL